jgi:excinuclease ABC subunit C
MNFTYLKKKKIPDNSGVYIFRDYRKRPIYIGRATSLKDRTKSYFANDLIETRGPRVVDMITKAKFITWEETKSVLEAIMLESQLIKRYQPTYNVDERDDKSAQYIVITEEEWPRVFLVRVRDFEKMNTAGTLPYAVKKYFGPFTDSGLIKEALKILRKMFPFRDAKSADPRHQAFYQAIGRSPDIAKYDEKGNYKKTIDYLILFFESENKKLRNQIEQDMKNYAEIELFEQANRAKKLLYALEHINDIALVKKNQENNHSENAGKGKVLRLEAYDVAHMSGLDVVGTMVVMENGKLNKNEYRKFKMSVDRNNDLAGLAEILTRRLNHSEWTYPDIIVVDGNQRQYDIAIGILQSRRIDIPVVAVTKNDKHKAESFIGNPQLIEKNKLQIVALNEEAHRFSIGYHRQRRKASFGV